MGEDRGIGDELRGIRDELDEHLAAINENTAEAASVHEEVAELDARLVKLAERVDALQALVLAQTRERMDPPRREETRVRPVRLTANEEAVVRVLLAVDGALGVREIGQRSGLTADLVGQVLSRIVHKGVPIVIRGDGGQSTYALEDHFRAEKERRIL